MESYAAMKTNAFRFSTSALLILTAVAAVLLAIYLPSTERRLRKTDRKLDVAISGTGYFNLYCEDDCLTYISRLGRLGLDADNTLIATVDGRQWPLEPPMSISNAATDLEVLPDGQVMALVGDAWVRQGWLQLVHPYRDPVQFDALNATCMDDKLMPCQQHDPKTTGSYIVSGWIEEGCHASRKAMCVGLALAMCATLPVIKRFRIAA